FLGGVGGGAVAGAFLTSSMAGSICVAMGVPTGGIGSVVCGLVVAGGGSYFASEGGGSAGEFLGELIYEGRNAW
ncbi:hypothetical protein C1888_30715, partial [Pseudomonas sp. GW531-T4]